MGSPRRRIPVEEVAQIVRTWPRGNGYAPHIARLYGIPIATAYRWVYEARQRGVLTDADGLRPCPTCAGTGRVRPHSLSG